MKYGLILLNGPAPGAGLTIDTDQRDITLGRDAVCELPLDDNHCSRLHARIRFDSRCWHIEDCGSSNGTFVNAHRIDRALLRPGDVIRVGESLIVFAREHTADDPLWQARRLASSTFMMRVANPDQQPDFTESLLHEGSGLARSAAVLCQLSQQLHQQDGRDAIVRLVSEAIVQATDADTVTMWLAGSDGRLAAAGGSHTADTMQAVPLFASLAIENAWNWPTATEESIADDVMVSLAIAERRHILSVLEQVGGNKTQACKVLGIGRGTLYKKLEEYNGPHDPDAAL